MRKIMTHWAMAAACLLALAGNIQAQAPANDSCFTLITLPATGDYCSAPGEFTNTNATPDPDYGTPSCWTDVGGDVWFQFTTDGILDYVITVIGDPDGSVANPIDAPQVALYRGDCVDGFAELACANNASGNDQIELIIEGLDNLENYYIRINDNGMAGDFQLCLEIYDPFPTPANDDCASAVDIPVGAPYCSGEMEFTNISAEASPPVPDYGTPSCWTSNQRDVWFTFTVDGVTDLRFTINGNGDLPLRGAQMAIYEGNCVDGFTEILCDQAPANDTNFFLDALGLTDGQTYHIRLSDYNTTNSPLGGNFQICADAPPSDINMQNGSSTLCSGTLFDSGGPDADYGPDEFLEYTICPDVPHTCIQLDVVGYQIEEDFDFLLIFAGQNTDTEPVAELTGFGAGESIEVVDTCVTFLFFSDYVVNTSGFEIAWSCTNECATVFPTTNDDCTEAINIPGNGDYCSADPEFSTMGATPDSHPVPSCWDDVAMDTWFTFSPDGITDFTLQINGANVVNPEVAIYTGDCDGGFTEVDCAATTDGSGDLRLDLFGLSPNETYYIRVDDEAGGTFQLCLNEYSPTIFNGTTTQCSGTVYDSGGANGNYGSDEFFEMVICPDDPFACIQVEVVSYDINDDAFLAVIEGDEAVQENVIEFFSGQAGGGETYEVLSNCVTLLFQSFGGGPGGPGGGGAPGFEVTWTCTNDCQTTSPTTNDLCAEAIDLPGDGGYCSDEFDFSTIDATSDEALYGTPSCWQGVGGDTWFTFTAGFEDMTLELFGAGNFINPHIALYEGDCDTGLNELGCIDEGFGAEDAVLNMMGLTIGQTYYIRVTDLNPDGSGGTFGLCLDEFQPVIFNGTNTECTGTVYDSGGPNAGYEPDEFFEMAICPDDPYSCIILEVTSYDIGNNAFLAIAEGDVFNQDNMITFYNGQTGGPETWQITGGQCVTLLFQSFAEGPGGGGGGGEGFEVNWTCTTDPNCTVGTEELQDGGDLSLFPNPADETLHLQLDDQQPGEVMVNIKSVDGRLLGSSQHNGDTISLDVGGYAPGVYFVELLKGDRLWVRKWVKR